MNTHAALKNRPVRVAVLNTRFESLAAAITTLVALLLLSGCYSMDYAEPGHVDHDKLPTETVVEKGFGITWRAAKNVMAQFPIIEAKTDKRNDRGFIVSDWIRGKSDVLYSGYMDEVRIPYTIRYKLYIYIVGDNLGKKTRVTIKNTEEYLTDVVSGEIDLNQSMYRWVRTESSTLKENQILAQIKKKLRIPGKE